MKILTRTDYKSEPAWEAWDALIRNAMKEAFSWQEAAKKYIEVYGKAGKPLNPPFRKGDKGV
ncbi:MAG: hypothetical protein HY887_04325 [Deltaproteobacteria bacterium]|nr:hypothetical protein [Deltaproteobacteria bacterium]